MLAISDKFFSSMLNNINFYIQNEALSIILFSILSKIILLPLAVKQTTFGILSKKAQPELDRARKNHSSDSVKLGTEVSRIYKKYNINPILGCVPILFQIAFIILIPRAFKNTNFINENSKFLFWHLASKDKTFILPILQSALIILSSKNISLDGNNIQTIMIGMISLVASFRWDVSFLLYIVISLISGILQDYLINIYLKKKGII